MFAAAARPMCRPVSGEPVKLIRRYRLAIDNYVGSYGVSLE